MKEIETPEQVYNRIVPRMAKAWDMEDIAIMVAKVYAEQFQPQWIKINSVADLPERSTEGYFIHVSKNKFASQKKMHLGIFNAVFGFISYYDNEHYKISEVTHYMTIIKPHHPKEPKP